MAVKTLRLGGFFLRLQTNVCIDNDEIPVLPLRRETHIFQAFAV